MNVRCCAMVIALGLVAARSAAAQSALERVEEQLRRQVPSRAAAQRAPAAAQPGVVQAVPQPGYLGVVADDKQDRGRGARIIEIVAGAPAEKAGLQVGDLITSINDQNVRELDDMTNLLAQRPAGATVLFVVNREGADRQIPVTLGERPPVDKRRLPQFGKQPEDLPAPNNPGAGAPATADPLLISSGPKLGIRTVPITAEAQRQFNLPNTVGALVSAVNAGSPAERAGIPLGAAIIALDGQPVDSPETLAALVREQKPGSTVEVTCIARGQQSIKRVVLDASSPPVRPRPGPRSVPEQPPGFAPQLVPAAGDGGRIDALEQRIAELEARVKQLEAAAASADDK